jgi:hypothetical protein
VVGCWFSIGVIDGYSLLVDYLEDLMSKDAILINPTINVARDHYLEGISSHDHVIFLGVPSIDACMDSDRSGSPVDPLGDICLNPISGIEYMRKVV